MKKNNQRVQGSWATLRLRATATALLPLMTATLPFSVRGWAATDLLTNANSVNVRSLELSKVNCEDFCSNLISSNGESGEWTKKETRDQYTRGPTDSNSWSGGASPSTSGSDDQWCADHGYITDATVIANEVAISEKKCKVTMLTSDTDCSETNKKIMRCQFHNSQLIPQCLAWKATEEGSDWHKVLLALDIAAAASCGTACAGVAAGGIGAAVESACQYAGITATATEVIATVTMSSGTVNSIISGTLALGGGVATTANIVGGGGGMGQADSASRGDQRKASCTAAVFFAALSGVRTYNLSQAFGAKEDACKSVQKLASSAFGAPTTGSGGTNNGAATGFSGVSTSGGTVASVGSGGGNGTSLRPGGQSDSEKALCSATGCEVPGGLSAATDGGLLKESGLDKLVGKPAADIASALSHGVSPEQALQSALGNAGAGELGSALATLAQESKASAGSLSEKLNLGGSAATYAASGGGSSARSGSDANPFGNLFGGAGAGAGGARATASEEFGKGRVMDIYHTGTSQNLFEIISSKVSSVTGRVGAR